jgi:16S rRNA (uracil1498-N3)-methyltransferase
MIRVRLPKAPTPQTTVVLDPDQSHHLVAVLRVREGDPIIALAADGSRWSCEVASAGPPVTLAIAERYQGPDADPEGHLTVAISTLKGGRTADTVRALTELGVSAIVVFTAKRTVARPDSARAEKQLARWRTIAEEATRQCGRAQVPEVSYEAGLPPGGDAHVFLWEEASPEEGAAAALSEAAERGGAGRLTILVGPEGGLDSGEAQALLSDGWRAASLGPRLLRAETAATTAAVLGLVALGERGYS